jgi:hypothetical protein
MKHDNINDIYTYMRRHAALLGERILEGYPALHQFDDAVSPRIEGLLRKPFAAQTIAIMGVAKRWQQARTAMVVAECGTGKTLISLGAIQVHMQRSPFTALAMVPPRLVEKWKREAFLTLPGLRVFRIDDLRNGGDEKKSHGVNEVRLRQGRIVREGLHTTLSAQVRMFTTGSCSPMTGGWVIGQSIKDAARKKPTYIVEHAGAATMKGIYEGIWASAAVVVKS